MQRVIFPGMLPSFLKVKWYKWFSGAKIGKNVKISFFSYILCPRVEIGDKCNIGPFTFIEASHQFKLGKRVEISMLTNIRTGSLIADDDTQIMDHVRIGGIHTQNSIIKIGKRVGIFPYAYINPSHEIILEDDVGIGGRSHLFTHGAWPSIFDGFPMKYAPITIKKNVWLAWRVTILPGVTIGENSVIQADTLVKKSVPENTIVSGNPPKISNLRIFKYDDQNKIKILKDIFREYHEYLQYIGQESSYEEIEEKFIILKIYSKNIINNLLVVFLSDLSDEYNSIIKSQKSKLITFVTFKDDYDKYNFDSMQLKNYAHFNLFSKTLLFTKEYSNSIRDIRDYFKQFGISFNIEN